MYWLIEKRGDLILRVTKTTAWRTAYEWATRQNKWYSYAVFDLAGRIPTRLKTPAEIVEYLKIHAKPM